MPAPAPYNAVSGRQNISTHAKRLRGDYEWLYRWSDEMTTDAQLNYKKLAQFVYRHCLSFRAAYEDLVDPKASAASKHAIRGEFASEGIAWQTDVSMMSDLAAIYTECQTVYAWCEANLPQSKSFATIQFDAQGNGSEQVIVVDKPAGFQTMIGQFRSLFD